MNSLLYRSIHYTYVVLNSEEASMAFMMTRIEVGDYDAWKPLFDRDAPGARATALGYRLFRSVERPGEVFVHVHFESAEAALAARDRLVRSGVLDRFSDLSGPTVVEEAEATGDQAGAPR
jgi:hypothetical protein